MTPKFSCIWSTILGSLKARQKILIILIIISLHIHFSQYTVYQQLLVKSFCNCFHILGKEISRIHLCLKVCSLVSLLSEISHETKTFAVLFNCFAIWNCNLVIHLPLSFYSVSYVNKTALLIVTK